MGNHSLAEGIDMDNANLAARNFTQSAIHIVEQLCPRAADRRMTSEANEQTVNMLALLAVLRWERKVGVVALERMGVNIDALARAVDDALSATCADIRQHAGPPEYQTLPSGQRAVVVDFDTPLEPLLATAEAEALGMDHEYVGTEHILLATIRRACPRLREILQAHGITYVRTKAPIIEVLRIAGPDPMRNN
jgi:ATP-dependent Clp protease ATP-binding subunit ClpA